MKRDNKHEFSFYLESLTQLLQKNNKTLSVTDKDLVHRIMFVVRLEIGDECIFFDNQFNAKVSIVQMTKHKSVECRIIEVEKNTHIKPEITILLPLLKRDSFESALYALTETGVNTIQLVITQKSQQKWTAKDHERALSIIHAAAEQSKQFCSVKLIEPVALEKVLHLNASQKIFFDPAGFHLSSITDAFNVSQSFILAIGPEGDLTMQEKELLKKADFMFTALTPTILRACQAASLTVGIIRSLVR